MFSVLLLLADHSIISFVSEHKEASNTHWKINYCAPTKMTVLTKNGVVRDFQALLQYCGFCG